MKDEPTSLIDLGFRPSDDSILGEIESSGLVFARVTAEYKESYRVKSESGEFVARVTGRQMFEANSREDYPVVGDFVLVEIVDSSHATIRNILKRKTIIKRKFGDKNKSGEKNRIQIIATNIDVGFIIESVDRDYNLNRFERYLAMLEDGGVKGVIILNKIDLLSEEEKKEKIDELKHRFPSVDIIITSTFNNEGLRLLNEYIEKGKTYCFLGSSGVGKSSLINKLLLEDRIITGGVGSHSRRGKHTTTSRQMYFLDNGGIVIDNPGIREVGLADSVQGVDLYFDEITALSQKCKYVDCTHTHEPGCAVSSAVGLGEIKENEYNNYINLKKESEFFEMSDMEKRQKNKNFGKFLKKAKKELKDFGHENY